MDRERIPFVTVVAVGLALVAAVVQYTVPVAIPVLQRQSRGLPPGQWWRLVTPLLVQTLGWYQVVTNLVTLAAVGVVAEWQLGRWRWAALFAAGTVGGQVAAYAWHSPGGGDSIAICGLAGGVVAWLLARPERSERWAVPVVVCYVAALTGWGLHGIRFAAVAVVAAVVALLVVRARRIVLVGAVVCALVLAVHDDLHGVSLVAGMIAGALLVAITRPPRGVPGTRSCSSDSRTAPRRTA